MLSHSLSGRPARDSTRMNWHLAFVVQPVDNTSILPMNHSCPSCPYPALPVLPVSCLDVLPVVLVLAVLPVVLVLPSCPSSLSLPVACRTGVRVSCLGCPAHIVWT